ncbi:unnamed protein product [Pleuronectes platessa]|uniref:BED-type domain-containing protein n=1 Tax=Pleuronectes platessa TaxID=8262 RepID=A0A9N7UEZ1_PLEPL|nr:unnamed protein product [Pleuronectes platessa]
MLDTTDITTSPETEDIVEKKGNATSGVWTWFGYGKNDKEQTKPVCKICRRSVPCRTGNTTNLFNHLRRHHPSDYTESLTLWAQVCTTPNKETGKTTAGSTSCQAGSVIRVSGWVCMAAQLPQPLLHLRKVWHGVAHPSQASTTKISLRVFAGSEDPSSSSYTKNSK